MYAYLYVCLSFFVEISTTLKVRIIRIYHSNVVKQSLHCLHSPCEQSPINLTALSSAVNSLLSSILPTAESPQSTPQPTPRSTPAWYSGENHLMASEMYMILITSESESTQQPDSFWERSRSSSEAFQSSLAVTEPRG